MNGFFCIKFDDSRYPDDLPQIVSAFTDYDRREVYEVNNEVIYLFSLESGSKIQGRSEDDRYILIFSGVLQYPLPGWCDAAPSESPDVAAEYLLNRYIRIDNQFLDNVYGQFTVLLLDKLIGRLIASTDGNGYRRLFKLKKDDLFCIGTHLHFYKSGIDESDIGVVDQAFYLSYEFLPENKTIYPDVTYLPAETIVVSEKNVNLHNKRYSYKANVKNLLHAEEDEVYDLLYDEFVGAIQRQVPTEKKVAVLLGGFDSAIIASVLKNIGKDVETFSFYFEDEGYNQKHTNTLSRYLDIKHNWVHITPEVIRKGVDKYPIIFNQASSLAHYHIQTNYVIEIMKNKGFQYCFTGDGCDELFLGYPTVYRRARIFSKLGVMPGMLVKVIRKVLSMPLIEDKLGHISRLIRNVALVFGRQMPERGFVANRIFDEFSLARFMPRMNSGVESLVENNLRKVAKRYENLSTIRLAYMGKSIVSSTKNKMEGSALNTGVVIQSPFFDEKFRQIASAIPESYIRPEEKVKQRMIGKYAFVEMALKYNLLPEEVILQKKASPVTAPIDYWYMNDLKQYVLDKVKEYPETYNEKYIETILAPKKLEEYMRNKMLGKYTMQIISLLLTYSSYFRKDQSL